MVLLNFHLMFIVVDSNHFSHDLLVHVFRATVKGFYSIKFKLWANSADKNMNS